MMSSLGKPGRVNSALFLTCLKSCWPQGIPHPTKFGLAEKVGYLDIVDGRAFLTDDHFRRIMDFYWWSPNGAYFQGPSPTKRWSRCCGTRKALRSERRPLARAPPTTSASTLWSKNGELTLASSTGGRRRIWRRCRPLDSSRTSRRRSQTTPAQVISSPERSSLFSICLTSIYVGVLKTLCMNARP